MGLGQLLAVSDAVVRKGDENSPFQPTTQRVVPRFDDTPAGREPRDTDPANVNMKQAVASRGLDYAFEDRRDGWSTLNRNRRRSTSGPRQMSVLGSVSIVRNDLSDSDFVVVPQRPEATKQGATGSVWNRVGARLMSLGLGWFKNGQ